MKSPETTSFKDRNLKDRNLRTNTQIVAPNTLHRTRFLDAPGGYIVHLRAFLPQCICIDPFGAKVLSVRSKENVRTR